MPKMIQTIMFCLLPSLTNAGKKELELIKEADCLEMEREGWREFGTLIFPSRTIIWWQDLELKPRSWSLY